MYDLFKYICTDDHILNKSKPEKFYILIALAISDNQNILNNQRSIVQAKTNILVQLKKNIISRRDHNQNKAKPKFVRLE